MTKNDLSLLAEVLRASKGTHPITCNTTWNGFEAGQTYQAEINTAGEVFANDKHGIATAITSNCTFFDVINGLPVAPTKEDRIAQGKEESAAKLNQLAVYLTLERGTYGPGQIVEWIPGLCNRRLPSNNAVMYVVEQTDVVVSKPNGSAADPNDSELVDLRVACMATSGRDDEHCVVEVMVDSRRVQLWGNNWQ